MSWITGLKRLSLFPRLPRAARASATITTTIPAAAATTPHRGFASTVAIMAAKRDPCTNANYTAWRTKHTSVDFKIDFEARRLKGSVILQLESQTDRASNEITLDTRHVDVSLVRINSAESQWSLDAHSEPYGAPLRVTVPEGAAKGELVSLAIDLETTDKCTALQWLTPAQTSSKKHPYMFSQCQAINARSIFPCQDTPDVKSTVSFAFTSTLPVVASGLPVGDHTPIPGVDKVYRFEQKVPIPSYLFAVASGDVATASIGSRSDVVTGPNELDGCRWELERDMEKFLEVAEKLVSPYHWGQYNVLVLPPSFPYGGMENPIYTFATPTIISGDRQNVDVIAHELSHSWSGNLVSNASWEHFWLNEGWTTYLERRIGAALHGPSLFDFSAIIGWKALEDSVDRYGKDHEYTKLIISHDNVDPEDVYSTVAYEKGFHFLYFLDRLVGRDNFDKFIPHYFNTWAEKSLDSFEFKATFMDFFNGLGVEEITKRIATIDWDSWFYTPGLPPKPDFDTTLAKQCYELAEKWESQSFEPRPEDVADFTSNQKIVFLEKLQQSDTMTIERSRLLGEVYDLLNTKNVELKFAYLLIALKVDDASQYAATTELLGQVGRMKFVRPLYRCLNRVARALALETFEKNKDFYHPICKGMVQKDLGL
ncbi:Leukotriene A-4 hydrolase -like protein [Escovopsis weberi]|uniref:Leukotriene A-4 hydrolase-like protein n=1 Tax=Escovopsis weberi TaxID=150374 RepID=A0A0M8MVB6_ESCWE|nr:Leukotriene A-4 hydrolase -like protein [Escovopsis weberi]